MAKKVPQDKRGQILETILGLTDNAFDLQEQMKRHDEVLEGWIAFEEMVEPINQFVSDWLTTPATLAQDVFESVFGLMAMLEQSPPDADKSSPLATGWLIDFAGTGFLSDIANIAQALRVFTAIHIRPPAEIGKIAEAMFSLSGSILELDIGKNEDRHSALRLMSASLPEIIISVASVHAWARFVPKKGRKSKPEQVSEIKKNLVFNTIIEWQKKHGIQQYPTRAALRRALEEKGIPIENEALTEIRKEWNKGGIRPSGP